MNQEVFLTLLLVLGFVLLTGLRVPITFAMLFTAFVYVLISAKMPMRYVSQTMITGISRFTILATPLFMTAGELMNHSGITKRLFNFADVLVGHITGGLGHVNVLASLFFAGVSGSANADCVGLGNIEITAMKSKGYDADFAVGITAASSIIGPIFPPSGPMILFGTLSSISVGAMFMGGATIGIIMAVFLMVTVYITCKNRNYPVRPRATLKEIVRSFKESFWALLMPPLLIICLTSGIVATTEVGALAVMYAFFLGFFVYRELTVKSFIPILKKVVETVGMIMMLISAGQVFAGVLGAQRVPSIVGNFLFSLTSNHNILILIIICFLLFLGTFMETTAAILICIPLMLPIAQQIGMNMVQFGVLLIFTLMIGLLTPPMAICLFITSKIGGITFLQSFKAVKVYYIAFIIIALLVAYIPPLTLWLPRLLYGPSVG
jgi:tripartite ATP-independent transporter DctM subunit